MLSQTLYNLNQMVKKNNIVLKILWIDLLVEKDCKHVESYDSSGKPLFLCAEGSENWFDPNTKAPVSFAGVKDGVRTRPMTVTYALKWLASKRRGKLTQSQLAKRGGPTASAQNARQKCEFGKVVNANKQCEDCKACPSNKYRKGCQDGWKRKPTATKGDSWIPAPNPGVCQTCEKCQKWSMRANCGTNEKNTGAKAADSGRCVACSLLCPAGEYSSDCSTNQNHNDPARTTAITHQPGGEARDAQGGRSRCAACPKPQCKPNEKFPDYTKHCTWKLHSSIDKKVEWGRTNRELGFMGTMPNTCVDCEKRFSSSAYYECGSGQCTSVPACNRNTDVLLGCGDTSGSNKGLGKCVTFTQMANVPHSLIDFKNEFKSKRPCADYGGKTYEVPWIVSQEKAVKVWNQAKSLVVGKMLSTEADAKRALLTKACTIIERCKCKPNYTPRAPEYCKNYCSNFLLRNRASCPKCQVEQCTNGEGGLLDDEKVVCIWEAPPPPPGPPVAYYDDGWDYVPPEGFSSQGSSKAGGASQTGGEDPWRNEDPWDQNPFGGLFGRRLHGEEWDDEQPEEWRYDSAIGSADQPSTPAARFSLSEHRTSNHSFDSTAAAMLSNGDGGGGAAEFGSFLSEEAWLRHVHMELSGTNSVDGWLSEEAWMQQAQGATGEVHVGLSRIKRRLMPEGDDDLLANFDPMVNPEAHEEEAQDEVEHGRRILEAGRQGRRRRLAFTRPTRSTAGAGSMPAYNSDGQCFGSIDGNPYSGASFMKQGKEDDDDDEDEGKNRRKKGKMKDGEHLIPPTEEELADKEFRHPIWAAPPLVLGGKIYFDAGFGVQLQGELCLQYRRMALGITPFVKVLVGVDVYLELVFIRGGIEFELMLFRVRWAGSVPPLSPRVWAFFPFPLAAHCLRCCGRWASS